MASSYTFNARPMTRQIKRAMGDRLKVAGELLRDAIRDDIDTPGYVQTNPRVKPGSRTKTALAGRRIDVVRSAPGDPPFEQTGALWRSYGVEVQRAVLGARIGSDLPKARYLEFGTKIMAPRPHVRRNFLARGHDMARILCAPIL